MLSKKVVKELVRRGCTEWKNYGKYRLYIPGGCSSYIDVETEKLVSCMPASSDKIAKELLDAFLAAKKNENLATILADIFITEKAKSNAHVVDETEQDMKACEDADKKADIRAWMYYGF